MSSPSNRADLMSTKRVFISVIAARGGVGKSTSSEVIITTFEIPPHMAYTTDTANSTLSKIGSTSNPIENILYERPETAFFKMMNPLLATQSGVVCVDHGAREEELVHGKWRTLISAAGRQNIKFIVARPVTPDPTAMNTALACAEAVTEAGGGMVVLLNRHTPWRDLDNRQWKSNERRVKLLDKAFQEVSLEKVPTATAVDGWRLGRNMREVVTLDFVPRTFMQQSQQEKENANVEQAKRVFGFPESADLHAYLADQMPPIRRAFNEVLRRLGA